MPSDPSNSKQKQSVRASKAWVSLGGNIPWNGLAGAELFQAVVAALTKEGFAITRASKVWVGPAWPEPADPPFFNAVVEGRWAGGAPELMVLLLKTEEAFGRQRSVKNAPRTLDLDLLDLEGGRGRFEPDLEVPHPRLSGRAFILGPLAQAAPDWRHPLSERSAQELFEVAENNKLYRSATEMSLKAAEISANP
jgi:2-amino-4-hydroxy-6-hydroxymethyldihydropteridine diphosphokinase